MAGGHPGPRPHAGPDCSRSSVHVQHPDRQTCREDRSRRGRDAARSTALARSRNPGGVFLGAGDGQGVSDSGERPGTAPAIPEGCATARLAILKRQAAPATASDQGTHATRWGAKLAVCVDAQFFDSIGGPSRKPTQDLDSGDIIWVVPEIVAEARGSWRLRRGHWEVLTLEETEVKLQAARTVSRAEFEESLAGRLTDLRSGAS